MAETTTGWRPIAEAPKGRDANGKMHKALLIARYPAEFTTMPTWSDIRECWWDDSTGAWGRWPHSFPPTHFMPSPALPLDLSTAVEG